MMGDSLVDLLIHPRLCLIQGSPGVPILVAASQETGNTYSCRVMGDSLVDLLIHPQVCLIQGSPGVSIRVSASQETGNTYLTC